MGNSAQNAVKKMTPLTSKIIKEHLVYQPRIGSVLPINLSHFPGYLTSTCLRKIADTMDEYDQKGEPKNMVRCNSLSELIELSDKIPDNHPLKDK